LKLEKLINSGIPILCGTLLFVMVLLTFLQIVLRQFFNYTFNWSDEVAQFCMSWNALFGIIWVTKNGQHLNTGLKLHKKLNIKQIALIDAGLALFISVVSAIVAYHTAIASFSALGTDSLSLGWIKMGYVFFALPLAMLGVCYYYLKSFLKKLASLFKKD
jgi:TRAP-type C4-dicarboxylate transport system permease small subunit